MRGQGSAAYGGQSTTKNRQQRRSFDRQLRKHIQRDGDNCSICRNRFGHNSRTFGGFDRWGNIALTGPCCGGQLAEILVSGLYTDRNYDFLPQPREGGEPATVEPTVELINEMITACQQAVADTDQHLDGVEQRGGVARMRQVNVLDHPWKTDDRIWFEQNSRRSHRARPPFSGEADDAAATTPPGYSLIICVRQIEPGKRAKSGFYVSDCVQPIPDDEAVCHALFEISMQHEAVPANGAEMGALIEKYSAAVHERQQ